MTLLVITLPTAASTVVYYFPLWHRRDNATLSGVCWMLELMSIVQTEGAEQVKVLNWYLQTCATASIT